MVTWPYDHNSRSRFYGENLDLRCREADGQPIAVMSIAHEAVRNELNRIVAEAVRRGVDGICLAFNRGVPLVRYEQPVLDDYRERFGGDARLVPDTDPQLRLIWREFVARWFREIRAILDQAPSDSGSRRTLAVIGGATLEWNLGFGIDVGDLARRGLLDVMIPHPELRLMPGAGAPPSYNAYQPIDIDAYVRELKGTGAVILAGLGFHGDHALGLAEYYRRAHHFYQAGAQGLCRWDTDPHLAHAGLNSPARVALWSEVYHPVDRPLTPVAVGGIPLGPPFYAEVSG